MTRRTLLADVLVFVVALALRLAYVHENATVIGLDVSQLEQTDNYVFAQWAADIANGDLLCWNQPHAYHLWTRDVAPEDRWLEWYGGRQTYHQAPLYPYFVAAIYTLFGRGWEIVGYAQALLGALTCVLTGVLARRLISARAGLIAGLLLACMGQFYFYDAFILRDGFMALLVVLLALAFERALSRGRTFDWLAAGGAFGLFTLAKETGVPLLLLALLLMAWFWRREPRRLIRSALLLLVGWGLVTSPAFVRNEIVGAPTFKLSTRGPEVFVTGNARGQDGVGWDPPTEMLRQILMDSNFSMGKTILLTLATHRADPFAYVKLMGRKTAAFFNAYEVPNNVDYYLFRSHLRSLRWGFVSLWFVLPAALLGLLLGLPRRRALAVPYVLFLAVSASVIVLYVLGRFRVQTLPLMALFAALAVDWALRMLTARRLAPVVIASALFALLIGWTRIPANTQMYDETNRDTAIMIQLAKVGNFGRALYFRDQLIATHGAEEAGARADSPERMRKLAAIQEAFKDFDEALRWAEDSAERHLWLGRGYTALMTASKRGELVELFNLARQHFEQALEIEPRMEGAAHGMGNMYGARNDLGQAYRWFMTELDWNPNYAPAQRDTGMVLILAFGNDREALPHLRAALTLGLDPSHPEEEARTLASAAAIEANTMYKHQPPIRVNGELVPFYDPELALQHARRALELAPADLLVREKAAMTLYVNDHFDEAVELLRGLAHDIPSRADELNFKADQFLTVKAQKLGLPPPAGEPPPDAAGDQPVPLRPAEPVEGDR